jgi:3-hydroxyisobutyrate dehydrogenase-like beta-hydroxyacid dehydrogenase
MNVGLLSPGEMGSAVAATLREQGVTVRTCLQGRSVRTRDLAERDRLEVAPTLADLVLASDVILSVVPPASALDVARAVTAAIRATGARPLYVDCNAVSPSTVRAVAATVGGEVVDVGIIGSPPRGQGTTRFYASGPAARHLELPGLEVRPIGEEVGTASALKMCYAALTKGFTALATELLVAAQLLGVNEELAKELADSQAQHHATMARQIPRMPSVAHRWIGEMEEIAKTFAELGLTPRILEGAADLYRFAASTPLGAERPETRDMRRGLDETVDALARAAREPARTR